MALPHWETPLFLRIFRRIACTAHRIGVMLEPLPAAPSAGEVAERQIADLADDVDDGPE
jgi:hypothetical protein